MRARVLTVAGLLAVAGAALWQIPAAGQTATRPAASRVSTANPRTPDGHPDFQGTYDLATLTPLERPANLATKETFTREEASSLEKQAGDRRARANAPIDKNRAAPPIGGDGSTGAAGNVGGYNAFWIDNGTSYFIVNGEPRTSIIVEPRSGRVPALTAAAQQRNAARVVQTTSDQQESSDPGLDPTPGAYDDPERRPLAERCLIGFGSTSGPPALPVLYNNLHTIVQAKDQVIILNEMNHDARIVRMNAEHLPPTVRKWMGDSVGRWEGDTLVVDTTNFTDKTRFRGSSADLHVVERFSRLDGKTLLYRFTISDPSTWVSAWTGEYIWPQTDTLMYEYACHEGNYALENILRGARQRDADEAKKRAGK
ncbi:MAG TPA: hypothetical protein VH417_13720 [Vicinamibacterales bacterium]|jgi:hypothetical protein